MSEDALKNMMVYTIACRLQKNVSEASCKSVNSGCYFDKGFTACQYEPPTSDQLDIMAAPLPGTEPRCPTFNDKVGLSSVRCKSMKSGSPCTVEATNGECELIPNPLGEVGEVCRHTNSRSYTYSMMAGVEDGQNMGSMEKACAQHEKKKTACYAQTMDLDFFGKKNPTKKKVQTAMSFKGITLVSKTKMTAAIASTLGGDVTSADIVFTKVHFPVKATLTLSTSMTEVDGDRSAFDAKFKKGAATDLKVRESDIDISAITEATRRRDLLDTTAGVNIAFTVSNAVDATVATAISSRLTAAPTLITIAAQTKANVTLKEAPTYDLEVEMDVATANSAAVLSKITNTDTNADIAAKLASAGIPGAVVTIKATSTTVRLNTYTPVAAVTAPPAAAPGQRTPSSEFDVNSDATRVHVLTAVAVAAFALMSIH
eukprot:CAMPEP_0198702730 /NCGR_PEP_ID=MMETSP1468-20131203/388931_1 /TAXON_ID=1461545 /ORGANISM="Mantoniella sp, Strain CCMP1436" /LENGTH=428 /DNA_ID=CAMNT_0044461309 /DNA_START=3325 /DNA_END=4611 /DNA_ORIENTATION=+